MKKILLIQFSLAVLGALTIGISQNIQDGLAFFLGAFIWIPSLLLFFWIWRLLILKKNIALAVALIVLKYPFLFIYVYWTTRTLKLSTLMFALGSCTITFTGLAWSLVIHQARNRSTEKNGSL